MIRVSAATARAMLGKARAADRGRKFGNKLTPYNGRTYHSKLEAQYAADLDLLVRAGDLRAWIPQVPVPVPQARARMIIDFLLILPDGTVRWQDVKGAPATRTWLLKRELVQNAYGIEIEIVKPAARRR